MEGEQEVMSYKWKLVTSGVIWYCTFTLGLGVGFLAPSLLELSKKFDTDISTISKVFTVITFFFLVGAIISGILFNYLNRQITSAILLIFMGIGTIGAPLVSSLPIFFCMAAIVGFGAAGYDTAQIVWIIEMWETKAAPYIQTQHFCYAIGTFVSPLLMKFYLPAEEKIKSQIKNLPEPNPLKNEFVIQNDTTSGEFEITMGTLTKNENQALLETTATKLHVPFIIGGIASIVGGLFILLLYWIKKYEKPKQVERKPNNDENSDDDITSTGGRAKACNRRKVVLILLSAIVLGSYQGVELCSSQFLPTFTRFINLELSQQDGALILSGLAGAFTLGRAIGIFIVLKILPEILLVGNIILIIIGNTLLLFFANTSLPALWGGAILLGIGFSTVFPSFYGFIEKHLKVSNVVGAVMIVAGGLVSSLYPIIIGTFIKKNPFILMYTNYVSLCTCVIAFISIYCVVTRKKGQGTQVIDVDGETNFEKSGGDIAMQNAK